MMNSRMNAAISSAAVPLHRTAYRGLEPSPRRPVSDPSTEKTVISVAGIEAYGTLAAGEFVTEPEYVGATLSAAPRDWRHKNVQFVLMTKIIDGTPGPPRVLARHVW